MSASTVIANVENDANAIFSAALARVTALEAAFTNAGPEFAKLLADAGTAVGTVVDAGVSVAAAATNPAAAAVAIGSVAVPVTNAFVDVFNGVKGFVEGVTGETPAAGASQAEIDGDNAGVATKNIVDAFFETLVDPLIGTKPAA